MGEVLKSVAFIFPGQGSQRVGMGKGLAEAFLPAREVFEEVDEALGYRLSQIIWEGSDDELRLTVNAQPALMAVSLAIVRVLDLAGITPISHARFVAGHSLGEYSALAAADSFSVAEAARLLHIRGRAMQEAFPSGKGSMVALLGFDIAKAEEILCQEEAIGLCEIANDNAPGQIVISGESNAVARAVEKAKTMGLARAVTLPVSAPFHCSLMGPAAQIVKSALDSVLIRKPVVPLISNISARPVTNPAVIKDTLVQQITGTVRWRESVDFMFREGVTRFYELGSGNVLAGLVKRIAPDSEAISISTPDAVEKVISDLS